MTSPEDRLQQYFEQPCTGVSVGLRTVNTGTVLYDYIYSVEFLSPWIDKSLCDSLWFTVTCSAVSHNLTLLLNHPWRRTKLGKEGDFLAASKTQTDNLMAESAPAPSGFVSQTQSPCAKGREPFPWLEPGNRQPCMLLYILIPLWRAGRTSPSSTTSLGSILDLERT